MKNYRLLVTLSLACSLIASQARPHTALSLDSALQTLLSSPQTQALGLALCAYNNKEFSSFSQEYFHAHLMQVAQNPDTTSEVADACIHIADAFPQARRAFDHNEMSISAHALTTLVKRSYDSHNPQQTVTQERYRQEKRRKKEEKIARKQAERAERARQHNKRRHETMLASNNARERARRNQDSKRLREKKRAEMKDNDKKRHEQALQAEQKRLAREQEIAERNRIKELLAQK